MNRINLVTVALLAFLNNSTHSQAASPVAPYTEDFTSGNASWLGPTAFATAVTSGGPDGSNYVSVEANPSQISFGTSVTVFNGTDAQNSSSDKFVGDWLAGGINHFSAYIIHNATQALEFSTRFATSGNFPGATTSSILIQPNTWTQVNYDVVPGSANVFPEGPPSVFPQVFTDVGNVQFFFDVPPALTGSTTNFTFGFDKISTSVVPEPATGLLMMSALLSGFGGRRRRAV